MRPVKNGKGKRRGVAALAVATLLLMAAPGAQAGVENWVIDTEHTSVTFSIRHFFSRVPGQFKTFEGNVLLDRENYANGSVTFTIDTASIDTNDASRDKHLRSDDFFDAENHPKITFVSSKVTPKGKDKLEVLGDLTIRGITRKVTMEVAVLGFGEFYGAFRGAFEASTTINRQDFKVSWNDVIEGGGVILGDDVTIVINLEARRLPPAP